MSLLGGAKHQCLVDGAKSLNLVLGLLEPRLKLLGGHLEVLDVGGGAVEKRNLARLLVGDREGILESAVAITKFIATPLLRLDALAADRLTAGIGIASGGDRRLEVVVILIGVIVPRRLAPLSLRRGASGGRGDGVEAVRPRDGGCIGHAVHGGRGVSAAATAASARSETIGRELSTAEVVDGGGRDTVIGRGVGTTRGGRVVGGGGVGVLADGVGQVEGVEVKTGR